jgi:hypothetical protein
MAFTLIYAASKTNIGVLGTMVMLRCNNSDADLSCP